MMSNETKSLISILAGVGLDKKPAQVYLALLSMGEATAQELARATSIKRPTVYVVLEELEQRGLVLRARANHRTRFSPTNPKKLFEDARAKTARFEASLPLLEQIKSAPQQGPKITFLKGAEGFKRIWKMIFDSGIKEYLIITDPQHMLGFVRKGYLTDRIIKEKIARDVHSRQIAVFSEYAKALVTNDKKENRISKIMPHVYRFPFTTIIFGNSVAFASSPRENLLLIIESEEFAKTQRSVFEALWTLLPERKE